MENTLSTDTIPGARNKLQLFRTKRPCLWGVMEIDNNAAYWRVHSSCVLWFLQWLDFKRVYPSFYYIVTSREVGEDGIRKRDMLASKTTNTHVGFRVTDKYATFKRCPFPDFPNLLVSLFRIRWGDSGATVSWINILAKGQVWPSKPNPVYFIAFSFLY